MVLLNKEVTLPIIKPIPNIRPTSIVVAHMITVLFSTVSTTFTSSADLLDQIPADAKIPDFMVLPKLRAPLHNATMTTSTFTCVVAPNGGITLSEAADDDEITLYQTRITIVGNMDSFKAITLSFVDFLPEYKVTLGKIYPHVNVIANYGGSDITLISEFSPSIGSKTLTMKNIDLIRNGEYPTTFVYIVVWGEDLPVDDTVFTAYLPAWNKTSSLMIDFENEWDSPFFAGGYGLISALVGSVSTGLVEMFTAKLSANPILRQIARQLGVPIMELTTQYLQALLYFTMIAKTRTIDSIRFEEIVAALTDIRTVLALGAQAGVTALTAYMSNEKARTIVTALTGGGASVAIGMAYLTALGTNKYYMYWGS